MYCKNCGQEIDDNADYCIHCGSAVRKDTVSSGSGSGSNSIAIVGFVFAFIIPLVGLICSILGLKKSHECGGKGKGLAIAGIVISAVTMVFNFIISSMLLGDGYGYLTFMM